MKIVDIKIKDKNGNIIHLEKADLIKEQGILGDIKGKDGDRQISILTFNTRKAIDKLKDKGLCIPRFYENLTIDGLDSSQLYPGKRLKLGEATIEISQIGKECFSNCQLVEKGISCSLVKETIFARVVSGGYLSLDRGQ